MLLQEGSVLEVQAVIDHVWTLDEAKAAAERAFSGRARGKCVVALA